MENETKNQLLLDTEKWLTSIRSENTKVAYEKHIKDFCKFIFKKDITEINDEDIENFKINYEVIIEYKNYLSDELNIEGQTLRTKFYSVKSWINHLYKLKKYKIDDPFTLRLDKKTLPKPKGNNGSKPYTHKEILRMIERAKEYKNGEMKSLLIELAYVTAWRKEALLTNFTYGSMYQAKDNCNYWLCDIVDKGDKEDTKPISCDLHDRICALNPNHKQNDLVFNITPQSVDNLISRLNYDLCIMGNKTFHGIKKASVNRVLDLTNDLLKAQKHGCHESLDTTAKFYLKYNSNYEDAMSLHLMNDLDLSFLKDLSKKEILDIIYASEDKIKFALILEYKKKQNELKKENDSEGNTNG